MADDDAHGHAEGTRTPPLLRGGPHDMSMKTAVRHAEARTAKLFSALEDHITVDPDDALMESTFESMGLLSRLKENQLDMQGDLDAVMAAFQNGIISADHLKHMIDNERTRNKWVVQESVRYMKELGEMLNIIHDLEKAVDVMDMDSVGNSSVKSFTQQIHDVSYKMQSMMTATKRFTKIAGAPLRDIRHHVIEAEAEREEADRAATAAARARAASPANPFQSTSRPGQLHGREQHRGAGGVPSSPAGGGRINLYVPPPEAGAALTGIVATRLQNKADAMAVATGLRPTRSTETNTDTAPHVDSTSQTDHSWTGWGHDDDAAAAAAGAAADISAGGGADVTDSVRDADGGDSSLKDDSGKALRKGKRKQGKRSNRPSFERASRGSMPSGSNSPARSKSPSQTPRTGRSPASSFTGSRYDSAITDALNAVTGWSQKQTSPASKRALKKDHESEPDGGDYEQLEDARTAERILRKTVKAKEDELASLRVSSQRRGSLRGCRPSHLFLPWPLLQALYDALDVACTLSKSECADVSIRLATVTDEYEAAKKAYATTLKEHSDAAAQKEKFAKEREDRLQKAILQIRRRPMNMRQESGMIVALNIDPKNKKIDKERMRMAGQAPQHSVHFGGPNPAEKESKLVSAPSMRTLTSAGSLGSMASTMRAPSPTKEKRPKGLSVGVQTDPTAEELRANIAKQVRHPRPPVALHCTVRGRGSSHTPPRPVDGSFL